MVKTITQCDHFGKAGHISTTDLKRCGCTRCLQEIIQKEWLATLDAHRPPR